MEIPKSLVIAGALLVGVAYDVSKGYDSYALDLYHQMFSKQYEGATSYLMANGLRDNYELFKYGAYGDIKYIAGERGKIIRSIWPEVVRYLSNPWHWKASVRSCFLGKTKPTRDMLKKDQKQYVKCYDAYQFGETLRKLGEQNMAQCPLKLTYHYLSYKDEEPQFIGGRLYISGLPYTFVREHWSYYMKDCKMKINWSSKPKPPRRIDFLGIWK